MKKIQASNINGKKQLSRLLFWFRKRKNRVLVSAAAALLAVCCLDGNAKATVFHGETTAWWGSLYPEFCFEEPESIPETTGQGRDKKHSPRISFWLAKALDW